MFHVSDSSRDPRVHPLDLKKERSVLHRAAEIWYGLKFHVRHTSIPALW